MQSFVNIPDLIMDVVPLRRHGRLIVVVVLADVVVAASAAAAADCVVVMAVVVMTAMAVVNVVDVNWTIYWHR